MNIEGDINTQEGIIEELDFLEMLKAGIAIFMYFNSEDISISM